MKRPSYLLFFFLGTGVLQGNIIYSNLGTPSYDNTGQNTVASGGTDYSLSFQFSFTGNTYVAQQAEFFINQTAGDLLIEASIYDDNGGVPGNLLYSSGMTSYTGTDVVLSLSGNTPLIAGDNYWFTLDAPETSEVGWYYSNPPAYSQEASYDPVVPGFVNDGVYVQSAFALTGEIAPAPEPLTSGLTIAGIATLIVLRRRN